MSRCFPYPPPLYVKTGACGGEGSIETTKLQKGKNKTETERRKEKKRQREKNDLLKKQTDGHHGKTEKLGDKKSLYNGKMNLSAVLSDDSSRSGLSEEHHRPVPESVFYLSDGTDSRKKRKLDAPSPAAKSGKNIRIRITLKRRSDPEGKEPACSTASSRDADPLVRPLHQIVNTPVREPSSLSTNPKLTRRWNISTECKEEKPSIESIYKALFEEFSAPPISAEREDPDDEEWLFRTKQQDNTAVARLKAETSRGASSVTVDCNPWPRAQLLPDEELFALPYTVPF